MVGPKTRPKIFYCIQESLGFPVIDCEPAHHSEVFLRFTVSVPKPCRRNSTSRTGGLTTLRLLLLLRIPPPPRQRFQLQRLKRPPFPPSRKKTVSPMFSFPFEPVCSCIPICPSLAALVLRFLVSGDAFYFFQDCMS